MRAPRHAVDRWRCLATRAGAILLLCTAVSRGQTPRRAGAAAEPSLSHSIAVARTTTIKLATASSLEEADPGTVVSMAFTVRTDGRDTSAFLIAVVPPLAWGVVNGAGPATIPPGRALTRVLALSIPRHTPPGSYAVRLYATSRDSLVRDTTTLTIRVREQHHLRVKLVHSPAYVTVGESYVATFIATELGNATARVRVRVHGSPSLPVRCDSVLTLGPGESRRFDVIVSTAGAASGITRQDLRVTVAPALEAATTPQGPPPAEATATVVLLRRDVGITTERSRFPNEVSLTTSNSVAGGQAISLAGAGALDEFGKIRLDYRVQHVPHGATPFGQYNEYRAELTAPGLDVLLGDQVYALSPLTEPGRYAFGAGAWTTTGIVTAGGFASQLRNAVAPSQQIGGSVALHAGRALTLGANYVQRAESQTAARIWSGRVMMDLPLVIRSSLDVEYGRNLAQVRDASAWTARLSGRSQLLSYQFIHLAAERGHDGYYAGTGHTLADVTLRPSRALVIDAFWQSDRIDPALGTERASSGHTRTRQVMVTLFGNIGIGVGESQRRVDLPTVQQDGHERSMRLRLSPSAGPVSFLFNGELGHLKNQLTGITDPFHRATASARIGGLQSLSIFADRSTGPSVLWPTNRSRTSGGVTFLGTLGSKASLNISAYGTEDGQNAVSSVVDVSLAVTVLHGHRIVNRFRSVVGVTPGLLRPLWQATYTLPFSTPKLPERSASGVQIRVIDARTGLGMPMALVHIGNHVVQTSRAGVGELIGLEPGTYPVSVMPREGALDKMMAVGGGRRLVVLSGRVTRETIALEPAAHLTGSVRLMVRRSSDVRGGDPVLADSTGLGGITVSLIGTRDTLWQTTDPDGKFAFPLVLPGEWKLYVAPEGMPAQHVADAGQPMQLAAAERRQVNIRVAPKTRPIRMMDRIDIMPSAGDRTPPPVPPRRSRGQASPRS